MKPLVSSQFIISSHEFMADMETPVSLYLKLSKKYKSAFLLESVEQGETLGRHSFLGFNPESVFSLYPGHWEIEKKEKKQKVSFKDPLELLKKELAKGRGLPKESGYPNFLGGFVGFFGYESVQYFESIQPRVKKEKSKLPLAVLFKVHQFILFDHVERKMVFYSIHPKSYGKVKAAKIFANEVKGLEHILSRPLKEKEGRSRIKPNPRANMTKTLFKKNVNRIKEYIRSGDVIQVVYSQRFDLGGIDDSFSFYRILRGLNPSPYMYFFKHQGIEIAGSSPEMLVRKKGDLAEVRPIAGTRPRGKNEAKDLAYESQLKRSVKERAEHLMLVDLARNDLGRVCHYKSIKVKEYERVERYSHVMHLVSDVEGKLIKGKDSLDLLRSTFPAGTLSGAPKVRAMEIIDELENSDRGPYGGSLGYLSYNGDMDMCITIRTLVAHNKKASVQAGAGIVFDSDPEREYEECHNKAMALFKAYKSLK